MCDLNAFCFSCIVVEICITVCSLSYRILFFIMSSTTLLSIPIGLWNCQSAVNKADFIPSIATHSGLNLMALTETWIKPVDTATPAALSINFTFSHTPRTIGRGGGTGLLISNEWKFDLLPSLTGNSSFESHAITITHPAKIHFVVVYRPPGQLGNSWRSWMCYCQTFLWYCSVTSTST